MVLFDHDIREKIKETIVDATLQMSPTRKTYRFPNRSKSRKAAATLPSDGCFRDRKITKQNDLRSNRVRFTLGF